MTHFAAPISGLVPMIRVTDVDRSAAFYRLLGFEIGNYQPRAGRKHWAWLYSPTAPDWRRGPNLMLTRGDDEPVDAEAQAVLFYMYAADLAAVRTTLIQNGVHAGEICRPDYMPEGEFHVEDPDGYEITIAQAGLETP